jgi:hypothetical protein
MNSGVRIVKQRRNEGRNSLPIVQDEKTHRQRDREIVNTVKSWIAEQEQRKRASEDSRASSFR